MRFGLIGAGCIGRLRAQAIAKIPGAKLTAVNDVAEAAARDLASKHGARVATSLDELLSAADIDTIIVSSPPQYHEKAVIAALAAGKHVVCEKPLSNSVESCRRMVAAAKQHGKVLTTGFNHRYFPAIQFLKKTLDSGAIGKLNHVRAFAGHEGLSQFRSASEYDKNVIGGGALLDVGVHLVDLTAYVLDGVSDVFGHATNAVWNLPGAEDNGFALLRNANGAVATLHASWTEWKGYRFHIEAYGDRGMIRAYYAPMMHLLITMDKPGGARKKSFSLYPGMALREKIFGWQHTVIDTFRQELTDFISLCAGGSPTTIADGFAGFRTVEIANAVYRSTVEQKAIKLTQSAEIAP